MMMTCTTGLREWFWRGCYKGMSVDTMSERVCLRWGGISECMLVVLTVVVGMVIQGVRGYGCDKVCQRGSSWAYQRVWKDWKDWICRDTIIITGDIVVDTIAHAIRHPHRLSSAGRGSGGGRGWVQRIDTVISVHTTGECWRMASFHATITAIIITQRGIVDTITHAIFEPCRLSHTSGEGRVYGGKVSWRTGNSIGWIKAVEWGGHSTAINRTIMTALGTAVTTIITAFGIVVLTITKSIPYPCSNT